jgi:hypothetical protein
VYNPNLFSNFHLIIRRLFTRCMNMIGFFYFRLKYFDCSFENLFKMQYRLVAQNVPMIIPLTVENFKRDPVIRKTRLSLLIVLSIELVGIISYSKYFEYVFCCSSRFWEDSILVEKLFLFYSITIFPMKAITVYRQVDSKATFSSVNFLL